MRILRTGKNEEDKMRDSTKAGNGASRASMDLWSERARDVLTTLVEEIGCRPTGSQANQRAVDFFAEEARAAGMNVTLESFPVLHWEEEGATLSAADGSEFTVEPSPFSLPVEVTAPLTVAQSVDEIEQAGSLAGRILLLVGDVAREQLFPRNFPFVTFDEHQRIYRALDAAAPAAVLTALPRASGMVGALYPAPMIEDGDFALPVAHLSAEEGARLAAHALHAGQAPYVLSIRSRRIDATASNGVARMGVGAPRVAILAHIDTKPTTPGALDNATGVATLLLLARMLREAPPPVAVELVAINGEDHYAGAGELAFLRAHDQSLAGLSLGVNIDGIGAQGRATAFSLYNMGGQSPHAALGERARATLLAQPGLVEGPEWIQSDHFLFIAQGTPAVAFTSEGLEELITTVFHTLEDTLTGVDVQQVVGTAQALHSLLRLLEAEG